MLRVFVVRRYQLSEWVCAQRLFTGLGCHLWMLLHFCRHLQSPVLRSHQRTRSSRRQTTRGFCWVRPWTSISLFAIERISSFAEGSSALKGRGKRAKDRARQAATLGLRRNGRVAWRIALPKFSRPCCPTFLQNYVCFSC